MLPDPLHPAVVHLPVALAVLLPLLTLLGAASIRRGWLPLRAWSGVVLLAGLLVIGAWVALETGESDEERVERVVAEKRIEAHEEAAELFMAVGVVLFVVAAAGLRPGRVGDAARVASVVTALALLGAGARVGHLGGELVYVHGAADAHRGALAAQAPRSVPGHRGYDDDDD
jgi:uncharacterized membrane protein